MTQASEGAAPHRVNRRDTEGRTPLHAAAQLGDLDRARFLLAIGAEVDPVDPDGETPLLTAVTSPWSTTELIALLEKVTAEDVQKIAREFFQPERIAASVVGNLDGFDLTRHDLTL